MTDLNKIAVDYFYKRSDALMQRANNPDPLDPLNAALIDGNQAAADLCMKKLTDAGIGFRLVDKTESIQDKEHMKVIYLMPHSQITGGLKILLEQANRLGERGYDVRLYSHAPRPTWYECKNPYITVHPDLHIFQAVPPSDVVIAGYWDMVEDVLKIDAPLKYHFSQGVSDIFEYEKSSAEAKKLISGVNLQPVKITTVSEIMRQKIREFFGRDSVLIPNAIDHKDFYPVPHASDGLPGRLPQILLVGHDGIAFKGHAYIIQALLKLKAFGCAFGIQWITQSKLLHDYGAMGLSITEHIAPTQEEIGNIYRSSDIYVCGSIYESFALPPLEAMACGTAVVTTDNGGVREFAVDGTNCLMCAPANPEQMADKVQMLLNSPPLRQQLASQGTVTALKFTWEHSIDCLDKELKSMASSLVQAVRV